MIIRKLFLTTGLMAIAFGIGYLFWQQEVRYLAPTPVSQNYSPGALEHQLILPGQEAPACKDAEIARLQQQLQLH